MWKPCVVVKQHVWLGSLNLHTLSLTWDQSPILSHAVEHIPGTALAAISSSSQTRASVHCSDCDAQSGSSLSIYQKTWLTVPHWFSFLRICSLARSRYEMWETHHFSFYLEAMSFCSGLYLLSLCSGTLSLAGLEVHSGRLKYVIWQIEICPKNKLGNVWKRCIRGQCNVLLGRKVYLKTAWGKLNLRSPGKLEVVDWNSFCHNRRIWGPIK